MKRLKAIFYLLTCKEYIVMTLDNELRYTSFLNGTGLMLNKILDLFNVSDRPLIENNPNRNFKY